MSIYEHTHYKSYLKAQIALRKKPGLMTELAAKVGCDRTYLSQVLSGKAHLTTDHAINLSDALGLEGAECDYFLLLIMKGRSSIASATRKIDAKLERLRRENVGVTKKIRSGERPAEISDEMKLRYYRSWKFVAAHILSSLPDSQTVPTLAKALRCGENEARRVFDDLAGMGLVIKQGARYVHAGVNLHLPSDSPLVALNHQNWRARAMEAVPSEGGVHYTDVFAISTDDAAAFHALVLDFIERFRKKVRGSGAEVAYSFCCDLFPLGAND